MEPWGRASIALSLGCWIESSKESKILSNTCYFCKQKFDEHNQEDRDNCLSKFENCLDISKIEAFDKEGIEKT